MIPTFMATSWRVSYGAGSQSKSGGAREEVLDERGEPPHVQQAQDRQGSPPGCVMPLSTWEAAGVTSVGHERADD